MKSLSLIFGEEWWFQTFFMFTPKIGEDEPILTTLPETNSSPLKMDGWNTNRFLLGPGLFSVAFAASFREGNIFQRGWFN